MFSFWFLSSFRFAMIYETNEKKKYIYNENVIKISILRTAHHPCDFYTFRIDINGWIVQRVVTLFLKARAIDWGRKKKYASRNAYDFIIWCSCIFIGRRCDSFLPSRFTRRVSPRNQRMYRHCNSATLQLVALTFTFFYPLFFFLRFFFFYYIFFTNFFFIFALLRVIQSHQPHWNMQFFWKIFSFVWLHFICTSFFHPALFCRVSVPSNETASGRSWCSLYFS